MARQIRPFRRRASRGPAAPPVADASLAGPAAVESAQTGGHHEQPVEGHIDHSSGSEGPEGDGTVAEADTSTAGAPASDELSKAEVNENGEPDQRDDGLTGPPWPRQAVAGPRDDDEPRASAVRSTDAGPSIARAVRRYPLVVALPALLLLGSAIALGLTRAPTYTSTATLYVGRLDVASQAIPGYVTAATTLASAYSRIAESPQVLVPTAGRLRTSYSNLVGHVVATPIPESPVFRISADASSAALAVELTQGTTSEIGAFALKAGSVTGGSDAILARYRSAAVRANRLHARVGRLRAARKGVFAPVSSTRLDAAQVDSQTADLQVQTLGGEYANSRQNSRGVVITVLNPATTAASDRQSVLQRLAFIGFFGGLVIGVGLAILLYSRRHARERRAA